MRSAEVRSDFWPFRGGLNLESPAIVISSGQVIDSMNYEPVVGMGYRRISGYERFDGQDSPSDQTYSIIPATITGEIDVGDTITGDTSTATAVVVAVTDDEIVVTKVSGTFAPAGEDIKIATVVVATSTGPATPSSSENQELHATYMKSAADVYRADILAVPGEGAVLGVWEYKDNVYAFRNDVGGAECSMFVATSSGWDEILLDEELAFTAGSSAYVDGESVVQGGVSATIARVVLESGSWSGTAAGRLIITGRTGGNFVAGAIAGDGAATASGAQTQIVIEPDGVFEFENYNFTGSTDTKKMYIAYGQGRALEFDGTTVVPIRTGMSADAPEHIMLHKKRLFLSFRGSVQMSGVGAPYQWTLLSGANEIGTGDPITCMRSLGGAQDSNAAVITTEKQTYILYGSDASDWDLKQQSSIHGGAARTMQEIVGTKYLSTFGVTDLAAAQEYGNYQFRTVSRSAQKFIDGKRGTAIASCAWLSRNQYRVFYADGSALYIGFDAKTVSCMTVLFPDAPTCVCSSVWSDGRERMFFGSDDGFVYQAEKGTSFDGDEIEAWLRIPYWHSKSPGVVKHYRNTVIHAVSEGYGGFDVSYDVDYSAGDAMTSTSRQVPAIVPGGYWDQPGFVWDEFYWDGTPVSPIYLKTEGDGTNMSLIFSSSSDYLYPHTLQAAIVSFTMRRHKR